MSRRVQFMVSVALVLSLGTQAARAGFFQDLMSGNGGADPFNKNNHLGVVVKMPQAPPQSVSTFDDPPTYTYKVDKFGAISRKAFGQPFVKVGNAQKKELPNGQTYFQLPGQPIVIADPSLWDHQKISQLQQQQAAAQQYNQQQQALAQAHDQIVQMQQGLINTPYEQIIGEIQQLPDQRLIEARVRLDILIHVVKSAQIADTTGFERLMLALNDEVARRKNLAQQQIQLAQQQPPQQGFPPQQGPPPQQGQPPQQGPPPQQGQPQPNGLFAANLGIYYTQVAGNNGTFGARLTGPPVANSPAANLGLEQGDVVFELDGQTFSQPNDVLAHRFQTEIGFIDVRSGQEKHYNIYIP